MKPARFGVYTTIGCIPWTAALAYAGYAVGDHWHSIVDAFQRPTYVIAAIFAVVLAIGAWRYLRNRRPDVAASEIDHDEPMPDHSHPGMPRHRRP